MAKPPGLDRIAPLISAAAAVVGEADLGELLRRLVAEARGATGARYAALGVLGEHGVISEFIYEGIDEPAARKIGHLPTGRGVLGTVIRENTTIVLERISDHPDSYGFPPGHPPMSTFLGVPVAVEDRAFGNLYLTDKKGGFDDNDVVLIQALSRIAGAAVQTSRLQGRLRSLAVVEERNRIARDLHDSVIQDLFAVGLGLQGLAGRLDTDGDRAVLDEGVDRLDAAVDALRSYIFELRDAGMSLPLADRLQELVSRMGSVYPSRIRLTIEGVEGHSGPDDDAMMLMATEALSNALRHAGAENVSVTLSFEDAALTLEVADDGSGFDPETPSRGMGLSNVRSRVASLGGSVSVRSRTGDGTVLRLEIPRRRA